MRFLHKLILELIFIKGMCTFLAQKQYQTLALLLKLIFFSKYCQATSLEIPP